MVRIGYKSKGVTIRSLISKGEKKYSLCVQCIEKVQNSDKIQNLTFQRGLERGERKLQGST